MSALTIRLPKQVMSEIEERARLLQISRADYIRKCIEYMNNEARKEERKQKLYAVSHKVRDESMLINSEFSKIDNDSNF